MELNPSKRTAVLRCSFCNKDQNDVRKLIAGPDVFICDECVEVCCEIMAADAPPYADFNRETPIGRDASDNGDVIILDLKCDADIGEGYHLPLEHNVAILQQQGYKKIRLNIVPTLDMVSIGRIKRAALTAQRKGVSVKLMNPCEDLIRLLSHLDLRFLLEED